MITECEIEIRAYVEAYRDRYEHDREMPLEFSYLLTALMLLDDERKIKN